MEDDAPVGGASVRRTFAVGLIAGEGVDLSALTGLVGGGAPPGFSILSRDDVVGADAGEDNTLATRLKEDWEASKTSSENPDLPMPSALFGCLLASVLGKPADPPGEVPDDDEASSALLRIVGGPNSIRITVDIPATIEEAQCFLVGGGLDVIFIVRNPPPKPADTPQPAEEGEAPPAEVPTEVDPDVKATGMQAEKQFADLQELGKQQRPGGHNPTADTFFGSIVFSESPEELIQNVALALINPVYHRKEYADWLDGVQVCQMATQEVDLRHYDETLLHVPHACLSVPVILNALLEQVAINHVDPAKETRALRQTWADNRRIMGPLDDAFASLAGTPMHAGSTSSGSEVGQGAMLSKADERIIRLTDPRSLGSSTARNAMAVVRKHELDLSLTFDVARLFPMKGVDDVSAAGLGDSAVLQALPHQKVTPAQARHGLLLLELEQLLGVESGSDGQVKANGPRSMADMSMHKMSFREELSAEALQQQLAAAVLQDEPEVVTRYYSREDALVVALCSLVPTARVSHKLWKSPLCAHLGFSQWLDARLEAKAAMAETEEVEEEVAEAAPQEVTPGAEDGEDGEEAEAPPKPKKVFKMPQLPLPEKTQRLFDLDARSAALIDQQSVMVLAEGTQVLSGKSRLGGYMRWHTPSHYVHMRAPSPSETGMTGWAVSVAYEDGACLLLRQIGEGANARVCASMSTADGVHVTLDAGRMGDGIVWRSIPHERAGGTRAPLHWTPTAGTCASLSLSATPASEGEEDADDSESQPKKAPKPLPQGAPADSKPKEADSVMVLPGSGAQVCSEENSVWLISLSSYVCRSVLTYLAAHRCFARLTAPHVP